jgi:RimJ/RimL family protein N-acetyltransferase
MITEFVDASWARHPHADTVVVAVQQDNPPSWRALEAAAFTRVWGGRLNTADPSDQGAGYLYLRRRPPS